MSQKWIKKIKWNLSLVDKQIDLDLLKYKDELQISHLGGKTFVKDPIRKKNILLQPEEFVRQLLLSHFIKSTSFHRNHIQIEKTLIINDLMRRFDMVIYAKDVTPYILVECKAPDIKISQTTFDQIAVYNMKLNAPYLIVTNGNTTYCARMNHDSKSYEFLNRIPDRF
jgi:hypothetical protein